MEANIPVVVELVEENLVDRYNLMEKQIKQKS